MELFEPRIEIKKQPPFGDCFYGAGDEARTRYLHLGKVALYRMSYTRGTKCIIAQLRKKSIPNLHFLRNFSGRPLGAAHGINQGQKSHT